MSYSCQPCRKSRRACDKQRPICHLCRKRKLPCGYLDREHAIFVNFDAQNIRRHKKKVLSGAIREYSGHIVEDSTFEKDCTQQSPDLKTAPPVTQERLSDLDRETAITCLDLPREGFNEHLVCLWKLFEEGHALTPTSWSIAFGPMLMRDRVLDLALFSLGVLRFAQSSGSARFRAVSLTAYNGSLSLFRATTSSSRTCYDPLLATTALVYAMIEGCLESPASIFESGLVRNNPHLRGAATITQQCRPASFQLGYYRRGFEKMREMIVLSAFANYEATFLARADWMDVPWHRAVKTPREQLYDIAIDLTTVWARVSGNTAKTDLESAIAIETSQKLIKSRLEAWAVMWMTSIESSPRLDYLNDFGPSLLQLDTSVRRQDIFLMVEYWTLSLILCLISLKNRAEPGSYEVNPDRAADEHLAGTIYHSIRRTLQLDVYGGRRNRNPGITEGQCRSLLPAWTVNEYERVARVPEGEDD